MRPVLVSTGGESRPQAAGARIPTVNVLGVPIASLDLAHLLSMVADAVEAKSGCPLTISYANAHTCNLAWSDRRFRKDIRNIDLVYVDGNGPRVAAWLRGERLPRRMTGADWIHDLCAMAVARSHTVYLLGGAANVATVAAGRLQAEHPGLRVCGARSGYATPAEWPSIVRGISDLRPDILLVGMGSPQQERWILEHAPALDVRVVWGTGGVLDYVSGALRRTPRWMRRLALEWLGRLLIEPRRLAGRYLVGLPMFLARAVADALTWRLRGRGLVS